MSRSQCGLVIKTSRETPPAYCKGPQKDYTNESPASTLLFNKTVQPRDQIGFQMYVAALTSPPAEAPGVFSGLLHKVGPSVPQVITTNDWLITKD